MIANYGYDDASGSYFISIDTGKCNGCGDCVRACVQAVLATAEDDYGSTFATVREMHKRRLKYSCAPCKVPKSGRLLPCIVACKTGAIGHTW